jgi:hypothetical protein
MSFTNNFRVHEGLLPNFTEKIIKCEVFVQQQTTLLVNKTPLERLVVKQSKKYFIN